MFCRMLVKYVPEYSSETENVKFHILSSHDKEMSKQSVVVSKVMTRCTE